MHSKNNFRKYRRLHLIQLLHKQNIIQSAKKVWKPLNRFPNLLEPCEMCDFGILNGFLKFTFWRVRILFCFTNPLPTLVQVSTLKQLTFLNGRQFCI